MVKNNRKILIISVSSLFVFCLTVLVFCSSTDIFLSINNKTDKSISGLLIKYKYSNITSHVEVPEIKASEFYKIKLKLPENFTEGAIILSYFDNKDKEHENYLKGYIEKKYHGSIDVTIDNQDTNGILSLHIDNN